MKVHSITIKNILGIESLEIKPGSVTEVSGENGSGKTSVLESIKGALGSGHDATLLRNGAEQGEVVLVLEDGVEISKKITADKSTLSVKHPEFGKIAKSQAYIQKLVDALSLNPVAFLTAPAKERVDLLLKAVPMTVTAEQLGFVPNVALEGIDLDKHALEVFAKIGKAVYDLRTGINRVVKEKRATAAQMRETLPTDAEDGQDWGDVLKATTEEFRDLQKSTQVRVSAIKKDAMDAAQAQKDLFSTKAGMVKSEGEAEIEKLRRDFEEACEKIRADSGIEIERCRQDCDAAIAGIDRSREEALKAAEAEYRPRHNELSEKLGQAKTMVEAHTKAETTRQFILKLEEDSAHMEGQSEKLTASLTSLEALKASLLSSMPIKGLEIRDGEIYVDGIVFDRVNESKRIRLAIEIAKLRAGSLGLVAVDGLEKLDAKSFETFRKEAGKSGLQFIISRVSEGELSVTTDNGEAA